ncbi:hypothetical protein Ancab_035807 [Ancistrocladus abbreviatus]
MLGLSFCSGFWVAAVFSYFSVLHYRQLQLLREAFDLKVAVGCMEDVGVVRVLWNLGTSLFGSLLPGFVLMLLLQVVAVDDGFLIVGSDF